MNLRTIFALAGYAIAIAVSNWMTSGYGMVPVGGGFAVTAGTFAAGAGLLARDAVQDTAGRTWVLVGITAGAALTAITCPALALASTGAFLAAETIDMAVYTPLRRRGQHGRRGAGHTPVSAAGRPTGHRQFGRGPTHRQGRLGDRATDHHRPRCPAGAPCCTSALPRGLTCGQR